MLFLVRWAGLHASLVSARDEQDLLDVLDQVDDPGGCAYRPYNGPVWVDFEIPFDVKRTTPEKGPARSLSDYTVDPTDEYRGAMTLEDLRLEVPSCDWGHAMLRNVTHVAFPHLNAWLKKQDEVEAGMAETEESGDKPDFFPATLRAALVADLEPLVRYSQARAALEARTDREAQIMKSMNVTLIPPAWKEPDTVEQRPEPDGDEVQIAVTNLASKLAGKLGVSTEAVVDALTTPEAHACLGDLLDVIAASSDGYDEDDLDETDLEDGRDGLQILRISGARVRMTGSDDGRE